MLITRPEESCRLCCVLVCDLETSRIGAPYIYDMSNLRVKGGSGHTIADKFGEVIAKGDFCTKLVLPFLLTDGTDNELHSFST